jgi:regulator of sirC expression with transglutaminase-like and TPR domain
MTVSQHDRLAELGRQPDHDLPLSETALLLSSLAHPGLNMDRYAQHIRALAADVAQRYQDLIQAGADDTAEAQVAALKHIIADKHGYNGDKDHYDNLQNADLACVIDQRKGLPIALAILALEAGRAQGWDIDGLNFPGLSPGISFCGSNIREPD